MCPGTPTLKPPIRASTLAPSTSAKFVHSGKVTLQRNHTPKISKVRKAVEYSSITPKILLPLVTLQKTFVYLSKLTLALLSLA